MSRVKIASSSLLSLVVATSLFFNSPLLADESEESATRVVRHLYPVVPFFTAKFVAARHGGGIGRVAELVAVLSLVRAGNELGSVLTESSLASTGFTANATSAAAMMIPALGLSVCNYEPLLVDNFIRSSTDQLANGLRSGLKDNADVLKHLATKCEIPGPHHEHVIDMAKTTVALITLSILSRTDWTSTSRFVDKLAIGVSYSSAYLLSESLVEHMRHLAYDSPRASAAAILCVAGAVGTVFTKRDSMHGSISRNLIEAGTVTGVNAVLQEASRRLEGGFQGTIKFVVGFAGVWLFVDAPFSQKDDSTLNRVRRTMAIGLMIPAAIATLDWAKDTASHLRWHN